jgi:hypothetical protein
MKNLQILPAVLAAALIVACAPAPTVQTTSPTVTPTAAPATAGPAANAALGPAGYRPEFGTMWTFDAPPLDYWKNTYGFTPDKAWLDNVRMSAVRIPGCSASFVSSRGLVMTNQHCIVTCTDAVSPADTNYLDVGFVATTAREEKKCPGMYADEVVAIRDVTSDVRRAVTAATPSAQASQRTAAISGLEESCARGTGLTCQVVSLYHGGIYSLYSYKRYTDLRLVFSPEDGIAFFGGDPDNFVYPRQNLDVGLVRVYVDGKAHEPKNYLRWSATGPVEGEAIFVVGNPGSTGRLNTLAQLNFLRDVSYPATLAGVDRALAIYRDLSAKGPAVARTFQTAILSVENSQKAVQGYRRGLLDSALMNRKEAFEAEVRQRIAANPSLRQYGNAYAAIETAQRELATFDAARRYHSFGPALALGGSRLLTMAGQLVRIDSESKLPDSARLTAFRGPLAANIRAALLRDTPVDTALEVRAIAAHLGAAQQELPADDPYLRAALGGRTPAQAAAAIVSGTQVGQVAFRKSLVEGGTAAVAASTDPLIVLARTIDPLNRTLQARADRLNAEIASATEQIGRAMFEIYGTALPPDATFTLRISDGVVKGYPNNGTLAPYKTTFHGLYDRAESFDFKAPWNLPKRWMDGKGRMDLTTPFNFVSTADIIGGNSGSPIINRRGEVVGVAFDGNIESLPNRFLFLSELPRTVGVHSRAITESLRRMYDGASLANELEGK